MHECLRIKAKNIPVPESLTGWFLCGVRTDPPAVAAVASPQLTAISQSGLASFRSQSSTSHDSLLLIII